MLTGPSPRQASAVAGMLGRDAVEVSGPRSGKSPRVAMLGRSPLALKQPSLGEKGRQCHRDSATLSEG